MLRKKGETSMLSFPWDAAPLLGKRQRLSFLLPLPVFLIKKTSIGSQALIALSLLDTFASR